MKLIIDGVEYQINLKKVSEHLATFYVNNASKTEIIMLENGKRLDFSKKSIVRTTMKAAMVPFVVPVIGLLYKAIGKEPPSRVKHEDLIDWMVLKMLEFAGTIEGDIQLNASSTKVESDSEGYYHRVESISTFGTDIFHRHNQHAAIGPAGVPDPQEARRHPSVTTDTEST